MKKIIIFDPAMCCATGVCGPSVDKELLRVYTVLNKLKEHGIEVERHNLTGNPQIFIDNKIVNELLNEEGVDILPITMVDGNAVKTKKYPTNKEFSEWLEIDEELIKPIFKIKKKGCNCSDGCC